MIKILELIGVNNTNEITVVSGGIGEHARRYLVDNTIPLFNDLDKRRYGTRKFLLGGHQSHASELPIPDIIFNAITDPIGSSQALSLAKQLIGNARRPVVNSPEHVENTDKERFHWLLEGVEGLLIPKTLVVVPRTIDDVKSLIESGRLNVPFIFEERAESYQHASVLISTVEELLNLECFAFDGREFLVCEFIDYKSEDNLYRKYRFFMIGGELVPGYLSISNQWRIKDDQQTDREFPEKSFTMRQEERDFLTAGDLEQTSLFQTIAEKVKLDYFSIDCSFTQEDEMILFDISIANHYFSKEKDQEYYNRFVIKKMIDAIEAMILEKLNEGIPHA